MDSDDIVMTGLFHPPTFFSSWSEEEFETWLHIDEYGNLNEKVSEQFLLDTLESIQPFEELANFEFIILKILKNESTYK